MVERGRGGHDDVMAGVKSLFNVESAYSNERIGQLMGYSKKQWSISNLAPNFYYLQIKPYII